MLSEIELLGVKHAPIETIKKNNLLGKLEKLTGVLPKDYSDFLLHFGSNINFNTMVYFKSIEPSPWADNNKLDAIEYFYGLSSTDDGYTIFEAINTYQNNFKMKLIPIGFSSGGNQICICTKGKRRGSIWFWDHEIDPIFDEGITISGLTLVAYEFKEFVAKLTVEKDNSPSKGIGGHFDF
ncbi:SMI1/KNR4 family protein [Candidatus Pantoea multigeneris]|uniref:SMI1/KNR4 family protein n=1 Tax=Candidatus Pantoea multigeneris TaxID=2608357 RepID=A0ABX0RGG6_9GAMM|nr:SMI1/KNR4 family protein [Pantoea multigeneris]NIF24413.1 SMI1/KNR4 family protein [Pantoea multigeneris]